MRLWNASAFHCCGQQEGYFRTSSKRRRWGLKPDYPMVAPNYSAQRQALAIKIGLGRKPAPPLPAGEGQAPAQGKRLLTGSARTAL